YIARGNQHLGQPCIRSRQRLRAQIARDVVLVSMPDETGWPRRVQPHQRIELVFQDHHHVDAPQELTEHDSLVDAPALPKRIARVGYLLPVLERCALVVSPEL